MYRNYVDFVKLKLLFCRSLFQDITSPFLVYSYEPNGPKNFYLFILWRVSLSIRQSSFFFWPPTFFVDVIFCFKLGNRRLCFWECCVSGAKNNPKGTETSVLEEGRMYLHVIKTYMIKWWIFSYTEKYFHRDDQTLLHGSCDRGSKGYYFRGCWFYASWRGHSKRPEFSIYRPYM